MTTQENASTSHSGQHTSPKSPLLTSLGRAADVVYNAIFTLKTKTHTYIFQCIAYCYSQEAARSTLARCEARRRTPEADLTSKLAMLLPPNYTENVSIFQKDFDL